MSKSDWTRYFNWLEKKGVSKGLISFTAFILGTRPEFINVAYNFTSPDFKTGFYIEKGGKYNIFFLNKRGAMDLLFNELYGMWRNKIGMKKGTKAWNNEVKTLISLQETKK